MRVLMTTTGFTGHVRPMFPFSEALARAGHEVLFAGPRSRSEEVERANFRFHGVSDPPALELWGLRYSTVDAPWEVANKTIVGEIFGGLEARTALPDMLEVVRSWEPDVIVRESYEFAGMLAGEICNVPHVRVVVGLRGTEAWIHSLVRDGLGRLRHEVGLSDARSGRDPLTDGPYLTLVPEGLDDPSAPDVGTAFRFRVPRAVPTSTSGSSEACIHGPLVYVTFGTVVGASNEWLPLYRAVADSLANLETNVLMTVGRVLDPADLGSLPPNVRAEKWVPQDSILDRALVTVGHGGFGTMLNSMLHGVPAVIFPILGDTHLNAERVSQLGAGIALTSLSSFGAAIRHGPSVIASELRSAVKRVLEDRTFALSASRIAESAEALDVVESVGEVLQTIAGQ